MKYEYRCCMQVGGLYHNDVSSYRKDLSSLMLLLADAKPAFSSKGTFGHSLHHHPTHKLFYLNKIQNRNFGNVKYFSVGVLSMAGHQFETFLLLARWDED
jgi:hypothetical protein